LLDLTLIRRSILLKEIICISLGWGIGIWVVQEILYANEDLSDSDCWFPAFLFVENRQTDGARWVDVRMEEWRDESTCETSVSSTDPVCVNYSHFGGLVGYSSGNVRVNLNKPPSQIVLSFPGMPTSQLLRSSTPLEPLTGRAKKPNGWSFRHCLLLQGMLVKSWLRGEPTDRSSCRRFRQRDIMNLVKTRLRCF
jgi:hypothetical protein